jgi:uncharacterized protein (TIGR03437 family)
LLTITANLTGLAAGTYSGAITLTCFPATACAPESIPVFLTITAFVITAAPDPVSITLTQNTSQNTCVTLTGAATVLPIVDPMSPWISAPAMVSSPGTLTLTVGTDGLAVNPNPYTGLIMLQCQNASCPNVPLPIKLTVTSVSPAPTISGIVPLDSNAATIQSGEWVSIYGSNLASAPTTSNGQFPTTLDGTSVTVNGIMAPLWYVGPGQINLQAPDDATTGCVPVVVMTQSGSAMTSVDLEPFAPSFSLLDASHVAAIILRQNGSGHYGNGTYDILGPTGTSLGYPTVAAKPGDNVALFGVGFGPTNPPVPAGQQPMMAGASASSLPFVTIDGMDAHAAWAGIIEAGLFQINITVPQGLPSGDRALLAKVGGVSTPNFVVFAMQ